jgi:hypothetical protein
LLRKEATEGTFMDSMYSHRDALNYLIATQGESYLSISTLLGLNPAYVQQYIKRGSPRKLDEDDRRVLATYFGVDEDMLKPSNSEFRGHNTKLVKGPLSHVSF